MMKANAFSRNHRLLYTYIKGNSSARWSVKFSQPQFPPLESSHLQKCLWKWTDFHSEFLKAACICENEEDIFSPCILLDFFFFKCKQGLFPNLLAPTTYCILEEPNSYQGDKTCFFVLFIFWSFSCLVLTWGARKLRWIASGLLWVLTVLPIWQPLISPCTQGH